LNYITSSTEKYNLNSWVILFTKGVPPAPIAFHCTSPPGCAWNRCNSFRPSLFHPGGRTHFFNHRWRWHFVLMRESPLSSLSSFSSLSSLVLSYSAFTSRRAVSGLPGLVPDSVSVAGMPVIRERLDQIVLSCFCSK